MQLSVSAQSNTPGGSAALDAQKREFEKNGHLILPGVVERERLTELNQSVLAEYARARREGTLFSGGGTLSGHLNCFPGAESRFVYETLKARGVIDLVRALSPSAVREPNIGCNLNLDGSHEQNDHVDGDPARPFMVINVAAVDTDLSNGAMEILCGTHRSTKPYWRLLLDGVDRRRVCLKQGDVLIRVSTLWHRGMPNQSERPRAMLAFTWEDGGSPKADPYQVHDGRVTFLPNRYAMDWKGRLRERAFVSSPRLGTAYLALRSLLSTEPGAGIVP
jgi:hypothetical protein